MSDEPTCPRCGAVMVTRQRRLDGVAFWGCPDYPRCRGTRELTSIEPHEPIGPPTATAPTPAEAPAPIEPQRQQAASRAGGSARAEFERRRERDEEGRRRVRPAILAFGAAVAAFGLLLTAFGPTPPGPLGPLYRAFYFTIVIAAVIVTAAAMFAQRASTVAWRTGAIGEQRTGELLGPLEAEGFRVIHDRLIPGSRANIDHIVVGPPGVFVVETKNYERRLSRARKEKFAAQAKREAAAVATVVSPVPVTPLVCVHRADLGWFKLEVDGVRIVGPKELVRLFRKAHVQLQQDDVTRLADRIEQSLRPATTRPAQDAAPSGQPGPDTRGL